MIVYTVGTLLSVFFAWVSVTLTCLKKGFRESIPYQKPSQKILSKLFAILSFLPLTIISCIRFEVGVDYKSYAMIYVAQAQHYKSINETLFTLFVQLLHKISSNSLFFFAVCSVIICGAYYIAIYRRSENPALSILLFVLTLTYFRTMDAIRQCLAMAILLFSLPAIEKGNWKIAIPVIGIAYFVHNSALVFLLLFFLCKLKLHPLMMTGIAIIGALFSERIMNLVIPFVQRFTHFSDYFLSSNNYVEAHFRLSYFLVYVAFFVFMLYLYYMEKIDFNDKLNVFFNAVFMGLGFSILTIIFPRNMSRLVWYTDSLIVLYVPTVINIIHKKTLRFVVKYVMIMGFLIIALLLLIRGVNGAIPYQTFWKVK